MQRPGPLRDLPLDHVKFADNLSHPSALRERPNKRPLSPNASPLRTPAKRQVVLSHAGCPAGNSQSADWTPKRETATPARLAVAFPHVVVTPRKLDFGSAMSEDTPRARRISDAHSRLEFTGTAAPSLSPDDMQVDDYFSPELAPAWLGTNPAPVAVTTRDSVHYPGFDVYVDRAETIASSSSPPSPRKSSIVGGVPRKTKEADKENMPPRIKLSRAAKETLGSVGLENLPVKVTRFASLHGGASSPLTTTGLDFTLKSKIDMDNLADRGQGLPWMKPGQLLLDDETMEVSSLSLEDEMLGRGWED